MENNDVKGKVLPFRDPANYGVFNPHLRKKLEEGVSTLTEKPAETITTIEHIICTTIVAFFRQLATNLGQKAGNKITQAMAGNE